MKKKNKWILMGILGMVLAFCVPAYAVDLTCDDAPQLTGDLAITGAQLKFDNQGYLDVPVVPGLTPNTVRILYSLDSVAVGPHSVVGRFRNIWGVSADSVPLNFTKSLPPAMRLFISPVGP